MRLFAHAFRLRILVPLVGAGLLAAGCSAATDAPAEPLRAETLSGEFETFGGETIDLASVQGEDVVFWFWAPW